MDELSDDFLRLVTLRQVRNSIVGNLKQKRSSLKNGVLIRITDIWNKVENDSSLLCELAIVMGSLAQGLPEAVDQLVQYGGLVLLINGLCHSDKYVKAACLSSLRHIYSTGLAPSDLLFQDINNVKELLNLLNCSPPLNESAAIVIGMACQSPQHQSLLTENNILSSISVLLTSNSHKILCAALKCLCAVIKGNGIISSDLLYDSVWDTGGHKDIYELLLNLLNYSPSPYVKLNAAICLTHFHNDECMYEHAIVTLRIIPGLVLLCKPTIKDPSVRMTAANTLAYIVSHKDSLQEMTASTDDLIKSLVTYFYNKPDINDEMTDDSTIQQYNSLCQSALNLLSYLASSVESVRFKVVTHPKMMSYLTESLHSDVAATKIEATRCFLSLSRSTKLLRTYLSDVEIHLAKHVMEMMTSVNEDFIEISTSLVCNLVLSFCPCRESLIEEGVVSTLCSLTSHTNPDILINSIWALMNCARNANQTVLNDIVTGLPVEQLLIIIQQGQSKDQLVLKCLGLLVNLTLSPEMAESLITDQGLPILQSLGSLLTLGYTEQICEQILCVLVNMSSGSDKGRDTIAENALIVECLAQILRTSTVDSVLMSACTLVQHLTNTTHGGHVHRQNCLEEVGVQYALRKLELTNNILLQNLTRTTLDFFQTPNL